MDELTRFGGAVSLWQPPGMALSVDAVAGEQHGDLSLAPHRVLGAQVGDGLGKGAAPLRLTRPARLAGVRFQPPLPAIQGGAADADGLGRLVGVETELAGAQSSCEGVSPDRCAM